MAKEIRQLPEETTPVATDWFMLQKSSNNQTSKITRTNMLSIRNTDLNTTAGDLGGAWLSQANAGTAGGTMYYTTIGVAKILRLTTLQGLTSEGAYYTVTYPAGFFSGTPTCVVGSGVVGTGSNQYPTLRASSASACSFFLQGTGTGGGQIIAIGI